MQTNIRKLKARDIPRVARILKKAKLKDEIAEFASNIKGEKDTEKVGLKLVFVLFESISDEEVEPGVVRLYRRCLRYKW